MVEHDAFENVEKVCAAKEKDAEREPASVPQGLLALRRTKRKVLPVPISGSVPSRTPASALASTPASAPSCAPRSIAGIRLDVLANTKIYRCLSTCYSGSKLWKVGETRVSAETLHPVLWEEVNPEVSVVQ